MRLFEPEDRPLYFKMSPNAWRTKCMLLSCEHEGFLSRVINFMWDTGQCVPDTNDGAIMFRMNVMKFRKLAADLIGSGHLERRQGFIVNARAFREIEEWNEARIKRARSAVEREFEKRKKRSPANESGPVRNEVGHRTDTGRNRVHHESGPTRNGVGPEKFNENNEGRPDVCENLHIERKEKEKEKDKNLGGIPPPESGVVVGDGEGMPPRWVLHPDGSYSGTAFEGFTAPEVQAMSAKWPHLEFPAVLAECDDFLAPEFDNQRIPFGHPSRTKRLEGLLAHKNRQAKVLAAQIAGASAPESDSCWFDDAGRLHVANGFKAELLEMAGGDEGRLRRTLDRCSADIGIDMRGRVLLKNVRSRFAKEADWARQDERKTRAVEQRGVSPRASPDAAPAPPESRQERIARQMREAAGNSNTGRRQ